MNLFKKINLLFIVIVIFNIMSPKAHCNFNNKAFQNPIDSLINYVKTSNANDSVKISMLNKMVSKQRFAKNTYPLLKLAGQIAQKSRDKKLIAGNYRNFGIYYYYNSQLDSATYYLLETKKIVSNIYAPFIEADATMALGGVNKRKGNITKAISCFLEAKDILARVDTLGLSSNQKETLLGQRMQLFNSLANFYNSIEDYKQAFDNYEQAYEYAMLLHEPKFAGVILSNKGDLLMKMEKYLDALQVLKQSKALKIEGHAHASSVASSNRNIAEAQLHVKMYDDALNNANKALDYYLKSKMVSGKVTALLVRGQIYLSTGKFKPAIEDFITTQTLATQIGMLEEQRDATYYLSKAYEATGDFHNALINHKLFVKLKDSIFNKKNIKKITRLEMQYRFDKENEMQKLKNANIERQNKLTIRMLILGMLSFILISGLLYRLYYLRKKSNLQLKEKNAKISETLAVNETLLKETHHRVKNNLQIISSLLNMQSKFMKDSVSKEAIKDSQNRLKSMSLIHQQLYQKEELTSIETKAYFNKLLESLYASYGIQPDKIRMDINIESFMLDVDTAIPLGLIVNELVSNAFKHGVDKETGKFGFIFKKLPDNKLFLQVFDNGPGFEKDFDPMKITSYGLKLIHILSQKLKADLSFKNNNGLVVTLIISDYKINKQ